MKIAVTAASGHMGSEIIRQLVQQIGKESVLGIARTPEKAKHLGVVIRKGDYSSRDELIRALAEIDAVLVVSGMDDPKKRIEQHRNIIAAAICNGVRKIVYTSIIGDKEETAFSPIIQSNRQTEEDVMNSGLDWVIGRNGLYIEPDLEYIDRYIQKGAIWNCAGEGLCAYTSRKELGVAYSCMILEEKHNRKTYNLVGEPITQIQLVEKINEVFHTELIFQPMSVDEYLKERQAELGEFLGTIIGGIYEGIRKGAFNVDSDFDTATGRPHKSALEIINEFKNSK